MSAEAGTGERAAIAISTILEENIGPPSIVSTESEHEARSRTVEALMIPAFSQVLRIDA